MASERFCYFGPQRLLRHINDLGGQRFKYDLKLKVYKLDYLCSCGSNGLKVNFDKSNREGGEGEGGLK